ncbi:MAG: HD domain-containing protein [Planctomycetes bacterium]|nr:HD domain-containing protein [Planctomycetota bacterium]
MYSPRVEAALRAAHAAHAGQTRKSGGDVPYVTHPVHVALVLARLGAGETLLVAALLHDVVEDCPGWDLERVAREFGADVAAIVAELTEDKSRTWEERKLAGIEHARTFSLAAATVKAADKLHNLRTLVDELRATIAPDHVWSRFRGGRTRTVELSQTLVDTLAPRIDPRLAAELRSALDDLVRTASA